MGKIQDTYYLMLNNPNFVEFVKENENKTIEEIAMEYDINIELFKEKNVQKIKC